MPSGLMNLNLVLYEVKIIVTLGIMITRAILRVVYLDLALDRKSIFRVTLTFYFELTAISQYTNIPD